MSSGCGCMEVYRFPHNYYSSLLGPPPSRDEISNKRAESMCPCENMA